MVPVAEVMTMCACGFILASPSVNVLSDAARRVLGKLVFALFLPCLIFVHLGGTLSIEEIRYWWFIPANVLFSAVIGCTMGLAIVIITKPPRSLYRLVIVMTGIGNIGNIPLAILNSICRSRSLHPFGSHAHCQQRSVAYVAFAQWVGALLVYTFVYHMLEPPSQYELEQDSNHPEHSSPNPFSPSTSLSHSHRHALHERRQSSRWWTMLVETEFPAFHEVAEKAPEMKEPLLSRLLRSLSGNSYSPVITPPRRHTPGNLATATAAGAGDGAVHTASLPDSHEGRSSSGATTAVANAAYNAQPGSNSGGQASHDISEAASSRKSSSIERISSGSSSDKSTAAPDGETAFQLPATGTSTSTANGSDTGSSGTGGGKPASQYYRRSSDGAGPRAHVPDGVPPMDIVDEDEGDYVPCMQEPQVVRHIRIATENTPLPHLLQPPAVASLLAILVGATPRLKAWLFGDDPPLEFVVDSLAILAGGMIPCIMLVLGGNLSAGPSASSRLSVRVMAAVAVARLLVSPLLGLGVVWAADKLHVLPAEDPLMRFVLLLHHAMPSSILAGAMACLRGYGEREVASLLFWQHVLAALSLALFLPAFMNWVLM